MFQKILKKYFLVTDSSINTAWNHQSSKSLVLRVKDDVRYNQINKPTFDETDEFGVITDEAEEHIEDEDNDMEYPKQDENVNEQIYNGNEDIDANIAMTYQEQDENVNDQYVIRFQSSNEQTQSFTKLRELLDSVRLNKLKE